MIIHRQRCCGFILSVAGRQEGGRGELQYNGCSIALVRWHTVRWFVRRQRSWHGVSPLTISDCTERLQSVLQINEQDGFMATVHLQGCLYHCDKVLSFLTLHFTGFTQEALGFFSKVWKTDDDGAMRPNWSHWVWNMEPFKRPGGSN